MHVFVLEFISDETLQWEWLSVHATHEGAQTKMHRLLDEQKQDIYEEWGNDENFGDEVAEEKYEELLEEYRITNARVHD